MKAKTIAQNIINSTTEPEILEGTETELIKAMNFYSCKYNSDKSKEYLLTRPDFKQFSSLHPDCFKNYGFLHRILLRGFPQGKVYDQIQMCLDNAKLDLEKILSEKKEIKDEKKPEKKIVNIKKEQSIREAGGIAEYLVDLIHENRNNGLEKITEELKTYKTKEELTSINNAAGRIINRIESELTQDDVRQQYKTGFLRKAKSQLILLQTYCKEYIKMLDNEKVSQRKNIRKPRKINKTKIVSKVRYMETHPVLGHSRGATSILGAKEYFVFDGKYLRHYVSKDDTGLQIKGTTIYNYDDTLSLKKVVRKVDYIKEIMNMSKSEKKKLFTDLKALKKPVNGRLNEDCFLIF